MSTKDAFGDPWPGNNTELVIETRRKPQVYVGWFRQASCSARLTVCVPSPLDRIILSPTADQEPPDGANTTLSIFNYDGFKTYTVHKYIFVPYVRAYCFPNHQLPHKHSLYPRHRLISVSELSHFACFAATLFPHLCVEATLWREWQCPLPPDDLAQKSCLFRYRDQTQTNILSLHLQLN
jgi:hypothetical protein